MAFSGKPRAFDKKKPLNKPVYKKAGSGDSKRDFKKSFDKKDGSKRSDNRKKARPESEEEKDDFIETIKLEGRNAVLEALNSDRDIDKIFFKEGEIEGTINVILAKAREKGIVTVGVPKIKLDEISESKSHQGVVAVCPFTDYYTISDILDYARERNEDPLIIVLDKLTDPHNLGAIIRTAEAVGAHGVIFPKRRASGLTGVVAKSSAGALNYMRCARVTNLTAAIKELKEAGVWVCCADMDGEPMYKSNLKGSLAIVIGGEGEGVSRLVKESCDFSVSIPMRGKIKSLNASVAASVILYEVLRQAGTDS